MASNSGTDTPREEHSHNISEELDEEFIEHLKRAEDAEEAKWILWLRDGLRDGEWNDVSFRAFVLNNRHGQKHARLMNRVDEEYGDVLREATA